MSISVAIPSFVDEAPAVQTGKFQAGVRPYAADDYVPSDTDLLCAFRIPPTSCTDMIEASAAVAAESSTGTGTEVWSNQLTDIDYYKAKVYRIEGDIAYIASSMDLFEENSVVNIMSSIVGNVFGFKAVAALRLEDMRTDLYAIYGNDGFWLFGGGTHGHPRGSRAGAWARPGSPPRRSPPARRSRRPSGRVPSCARRWSRGARSSSPCRGDVRGCDLM